MKSRSELNVQTQVRFTESGLEADTEVDTDLADWGLVEIETERESKHMVEEASSLFNDDRNVESRNFGEQETLFGDVKEDQVTLDGEQAAGQVNF